MDKKTYKIEIYNHESINEIGLRFIFSLQEKYFSNSNVLITGEISDFVDYNVPKGIRSIEACYLFQGLNYKRVSIHYDEFYCVFDVDKKIIRIDGNVDFYEKCMTVWNDIATMQLPKKSKTFSFNFPSDPSCGRESAYYLELFNLMLSICEKNKSRKMIKVYARGLQQFININSSEEFQKNIGQERTWFFYNYDEAQDLFIGFDFKEFHCVIACDQCTEIMNDVKHGIQQIETRFI